MSSTKPPEGLRLAGLFLVVAVAACAIGLFVELVFLVVQHGSPGERNSPMLVCAGWSAVCAVVAFGRELSGKRVNAFYGLVSGIASAVATLVICALRLTGHPMRHHYLPATAVSGFVVCLFGLAIFLLLRYMKIAGESVLGEASSALSPVPATIPTPDDERSRFGV